MKLLKSSDRQPFSIINGKTKSKLLIICDHASHFVPERLNDLGLSQNLLTQHIGWDIGAAKITKGLANTLKSTAILSGFSRLVIDPNRDPDDKVSIPVMSDNILIPGNQNLTQIDKIKRTNELFDPYHKNINAALEKKLALQILPILFSVHTFTPSINGNDRPWHAGVLWNRDPRMAKLLMVNLNKNTPKIIVGNNLPYSGKKFAYSLNIHAGARGIPHCAIEVRQDLVNTEQKISEWIDRISNALEPIIADPRIQKLKHY